MAKLTVTVVPVSLLPFGKVQLRVTGCRPRGEWAVKGVSDPGDVLPTATSLLAEMVSDMDTGTESLLENVGVDYSGGMPNLVFTAVVPMAASVERAPGVSDTTSDDWALMTPWGSRRDAAHQTDEIEPVRQMLIAHWRDQLEHTTAAFDFLPTYFTNYQVRAVYSSVWGERQAGGNFYRWLHSAQDVDGKRLCVEVASEKVQHDVVKSLAGLLRKHAPAAVASQIAQMWDPKMIGASSTLSALGGLSAVPVFAAMGATVGSKVAYQTAKSAGKPPAWYRRHNPKRLRLVSAYPVAPPFDITRPVFVAT